MDVAVARRTRVFAENSVDAFCRVRTLFRMAGVALYFGDLRRMREIFDGSMAIDTRKSAMDARDVLIRTNGNAFALPGFHVGLAVTGEAGFILLERLGRFFLVTRQRGKREKCN